MYALQTQNAHQLSCYRVQLRVEMREAVAGSHVQETPEQNTQNS